MEEEGEINSYVIVKNRSEYALSNRFYKEESLNVRVRREGIEDPINPVCEVCHDSCHIAAEHD